MKVQTCLIFVTTEWTTNFCVKTNNQANLITAGKPQYGLGFRWVGSSDPLVKHTAKLTYVIAVHSLKWVHTIYSQVKSA